MAAHAAAVRDHRRGPRRARGGDAHLLPRGGGRAGGGGGGRVIPLLRVAAVGAGLVVVVGLIGGWPAALGGGVALVAQLAAVAMLRPAMTAPQPQFMARWLGGMGVRALALGALLAVVATHRAT